MKTKKCFCDKHKGKEIDVSNFYKATKGGYQYECKEEMGRKRLEKKARKGGVYYDPNESRDFYKRGEVIRSRIAL